MINLFFDFDGTLFESSLGIFKSFEYACNICNLTCPDKYLLATHIGPPVGEILSTIYPGLPHNLRSDFVSAFRFHYDSQGFRYSIPYDGIAQLILFIHNSPKFLTPSVITNKPTCLARVLLQDYELLDSFEHVIGIDYVIPGNVGKSFSGKSEAISFLSNMSSSSVRCIYIGDTLSDKASSARAGCEFLAVGFGFYDWSTEPIENFALVSSVSDLDSYLRSI